MKKKLAIIRYTKDLLLFFILTFTISWFIEIILIILEVKIELFYLFPALYSPSLVGIFLTYRTKNREIIKEFWRRGFQLKRISSIWYPVIILLFPAVQFLTFLICPLFSIKIIPLQGISEILSNPLLLLLLPLGSLFAGPVGEELGWRGFALERLQKKFNAFFSSLILGVIWAVWHFPLFFMDQLGYDKMGFGTITFFCWFIDVLSLSIIMTWVYNNTKKSTLSAILIHFSGGFTDILILGLSGIFPPEMAIVRTTLLIIVSINILIFRGPKTMVRNKNKTI